MTSPLEPATFEQNDPGMPKEQDLEKLKDISRDILEPKNTLVDLIPRIVELKDLLEKYTLLKMTPEVSLTEGRTLLDSGMAVSPLVAAICAREVFRSAAFIKGVGLRCRMRRIMIDRCACCMPVAVLLRYWYCL